MGEPWHARDSGAGHGAQRWDGEHIACEEGGRGYAGRAWCHGDLWGDRQKCASAGGHLEVGRDQVGVVLAATALVGVLAPVLDQGANTANTDLGAKKGLSISSSISKQLIRRPPASGGCAAPRRLELQVPEAAL